MQDVLFTESRSQVINSNIIYSQISIWVLYASTNITVVHSDRPA